MGILSQIEERLGLRKARQYLEMNGYETKQSIITLGKSGKRHKIDLLALKADAIAKIKILISCKTRRKTIGKDSVTRIKRTMDDINANQGIIISLTSKFGFSDEARKMAANFGIELWTREDLEKRFIGNQNLPQPKSTKKVKSIKAALSLSPKIRKKDAITIALTLKDNVELISTDFAYLTCYLVQFTYLTKEGLIQKKQNVKVFWALYEGIDGEYYQNLDSNLRFVDIRSGNFWTSPIIIYPRLNSNEILHEINKSYSKLIINEKPVETQRKWKSINQLLGRFREKTTIRSIKEMYYPLFVSILKGNRGERWFIVDGYYGNPSEQMNAIFNRNSSYIRRHMSSKY
jgi:hypothetical protein